MGYVTERDLNKARK